MVQKFLKTVFKDDMKNNILNSICYMIILCESADRKNRCLNYLKNEKVKRLSVLRFF